MLTKTAKYGTPQADTTTYSYDQARAGYYNVGHQTTASNSAAVIIYNFDNEGRQVGQTYTVSSVNYSFTMTFDQGGRVLSQGYPDTDSVGPLTYDAAGRLKTVPGLVTGVLYDAAGHQTNVTRQNGASTTMAWSAQRGWLNSLLTTSTAGTIQDYTYGRDARGRITGVTSPQAGDSWIYGYDDLDRLLSADNTSDNTLDQTFTYDLVGNMLTNSKVGTYSYPAQGAGSVRPHAVSGVSGGPLGTQSFTYDANGSMTVQGPDTRGYDGENRLITAVDGAVSTTFVYAPDGTRLKKTASGVTTLYFGDDVEIAGGVTTKYLPGDAKRVGLTTTTWLHRDHLQSVRAITNSSGAILDRANYRPFGDQLGFASVTESKGYIGERQDDETQLMYLHARYYDPVLARFIQADPMSPALPGVGVNRYAYAFNNPVMMLDPLGLWSPGPGQGNQETGEPGSGNIGDSDSPNAGPAHEGHGGSGNQHAHGGPFFAGYDWNGTLVSGTYVNVNGIATGLLYDGSLYTFGGQFVATRTDEGWQVYSAAAYLAMTGQSNLALGYAPLPSAPPGRGPYSPSLPGWHNYYAGPDVVCEAGCTPEEIADLMSRFAVPGQNPAIPVVNGQISPVYDPFTGYYAGDVVTTITNNGLTTTNTTLPGHVFYDGEIVQTATQNPDGSWSVTTHGFGNDVEFGMGEVNEFLGPEVFNDIHEQMKGYVEQHHLAN